MRRRGPLPFSLFSLYCLLCPTLRNKRGNKRRKGPMSLLLIALERGRASLLFPMCSSLAVDTIVLLCKTKKTGTKKKDIPAQILFPCFVVVPLLRNTTTTYNSNPQRQESKIMIGPLLPLSVFSLYCLVCPTLKNKRGNERRKGPCLFFALL